MAKAKTFPKTQEQLKKDLSLKIKGIKTILNEAIRCELESDERIEFSNMIASSLRAILYGDSNNKYLSLIQRVGYDKKLLFPLYDRVACLNIIPTYNLLQFSVSNNGVKVHIFDDLFKTGGMWRTYLTYDSWLNEVVIDTKLRDVEPISRLLAVKIVADSSGAHVDSDIESHMYEMSKHDLLPVVVINGVEVPRDLEAKAKSIFCETILAIAKELIDAYEIWAGLSAKIVGPSTSVVRVQKYIKADSKSRYELLKYNVVPKEFQSQFNSYNSNCFYECEIYSKDVSNYEVTKNRRRFEFIKIDYRDILDGQFLGKSLYQRD